MSMAPTGPQRAPEPHACPLCDCAPDHEVAETVIRVAEPTGDNTVRIGIDALRENLADTYGVELTERELIGHIERLLARYSMGDQP